ncbi:MAG: hypothetical protein ACYTBP_16620, partial [Planctomycetota bacterium]
NGNYKFGYGEGPQGSVTNWGEIQARNTMLVGANVTNYGIITKRPGDPDATVVLAAGDKMFLKEQGSNIIVQVLVTDTPSDHVADNDGQINTNDGSILLAAGDVYSRAAITDVEDFVALANENVYIDGAITASDEVAVNSSRTGTGGSIYITESIEAGEIDLKAGNPTAYEASMARVQVADGKTLTSTDGDIYVEAVHDIILGGSVVSAGDVTLNADREGAEGPEFGGDLIAKDDIIANGEGDLSGAITILANAIEVSNVSAMDGDLSITGRTSLDGVTGWGDIDVASGGTLYASGDVDIKEHSGPGGMTLTGHDSLSIIAGGTISSEADIGVTGSSLLMQQGTSIDTADYGFFHQGTTNLTLISDNGSVTSTRTSDGGLDENAADEWLSIGATANDSITLSGAGSITTKDLDSTNGDIYVTSSHSIQADGTVDSGGDVTMAANIDITLEKAVSADGDIELKADKNQFAGGDLIVKDNLVAGGNIDLYASDTTIYLGGDLVQAVDNVTLHNNTVLNGGAVQRIEATTGSLYANAWVHKTSTGNLDMFGGSTLETTSPYSVYTREVRVEDGELNLHGNGYVQLAGNIYSSGDMRLAANEDGIGSSYLWHSLYGSTIVSEFGEIDMSATNNTIYLYGGSNPTDPYVSAAEDILLRDYTYVYYGRKLYAGDDIVLKAGEQIFGKSSLTLEAGDDIILGSSDVDNHWVNPEIGSPGNVLTDGDLELRAGDDIYAHGTLTSTNGDIDLYSSDSTTNLYGDVFADVADNGNITLHNNAWVADGVLLKAGQDVTAYGTVTGQGSLTVEADDDIRLKRNVSTGDAMKMYAGDDIELNKYGGNTSADGRMLLWANYGNFDSSAGKLHVYGDLTTTGYERPGVLSNMTLRGEEIYLGRGGLLGWSGGNVDSAGHIRMIAKEYGSSSSKGNVEVRGNITAGGSLQILADDNITIGNWFWGRGNVQANDNI